MNEKEMQGLIQNALLKTLKEFEENPDNVFNNLELQEKYNGVLKDKIQLKQENQELKKQLEEYKQSLKTSREMLYLQGKDGNYNYDSYMLGMYNGMEYIISLFENREPIYKNGKDIVFLEDRNKNQQKDFIEYLEEPIRIITEGNPTNISEYTTAKLDTLKEVLSKYKEIVGE